ncbi:MAG: adenosylcobinamide-GDP ribazoletransferase [Dehalococcoidia bacterium]|nr:adenosylcobinamide-GDP ribazoletransferase [Dehalococcoidia bacterium]
MRTIKRNAKGFYMALGMFCSIPLPFNLYDEDCLDLMLSYFPFVGVVIGVLWWGVATLLGLSNLHIMLTTALITIVPFLLSGFMHLDGYMDTCDAILSRRPLEEKLRILKDPNSGAFAVVMLGILFILQFSVIYVAIDTEKTRLAFIYLPIVARCCSALFIFILPNLAQSGYAKVLKRNTQTPHIVVVLITALLATVVAFIFNGWRGFLIVAAIVLGYSLAMLYSFRQFKGVSGDLAGFSLTISELSGLVVLALI